MEPGLLPTPGSLRVSNHRPESRVPPEKPEGSFQRTLVHLLRSMSAMAVQGPASMLERCCPRPWLASTVLNSTVTRGLLGPGRGRLGDKGGSWGERNGSFNLGCEQIHANAGAKVTSPQDLGSPSLPPISHAPRLAETRDPKRQST